MANEHDDFGGFDAEQEEGQNSVLPTGEYRFVVENLVQKNTKNGNYQQNVATFQVLSGEFINRKLWERYNFKFLKGAPNDKQKTAVVIGRGQFSKLCKAVGILKPAKCAELIGKTFVGKVVIDVAGEDDEFGDRNKITKYSPSSTAIAETVSPAPSGAAGDWKS